MKFPHNIDVYGNLSYRGSCPSESMEQVTFFARLRREYPDTWGMIAFHPRNEGRRTRVKVAIEKAEGMVKGTSDVIIVGNPSFVCEIKRQDHTKSAWQDGQVEFLDVAKRSGSFVCIALGAEAAGEAFRHYLGLYYPS